MSTAVDDAVDAAAVVAPAAVLSLLGAAEAGGQLASTTCSSPRRFRTATWIVSGDSDKEKGVVGGAGSGNNCISLAELKLQWRAEATLAAHVWTGYTTAAALHTTSRPSTSHLHTADFDALCAARCDLHKALNADRPLPRVPDNLHIHHHVLCAADRNPQRIGRNRVGVCRRDNSPGILNDVRHVHALVSYCWVGDWGLFEGAASHVELGNTQR